MKILLHVTGLGGKCRNAPEERGTEAREEGEEVKDGLVRSLSPGAAGSCLPTFWML